MIRIEVSGEQAIAFGPFPFQFVRLLGTLAGRKIWDGSTKVKFLATPASIRALTASDFPIEWVDRTGDLEAQKELEELATQHSFFDPAALSRALGDYRPALELYDHQKKVLSISWNRQTYALFLEMGLGKSAILIATAGMLHRINKISGVFIISPKGVHRQWIDEEIPKHIDPKTKWHGRIWGNKNWQTIRHGLDFFSMNVDAVRTVRGHEAAHEFLDDHARGGVLMIVDESHNIKNQSTDRTRAIMKMRSKAHYRRIATGTPIAKNVVDIWSQYNFLDPRILGHRYMTSFRSRYCVMGGFEGKQIVGQKNTEELYQLIAPHTYRLTKDEALDLPPKIYVTREYAMSEKTRLHYNELKKTFMTELDNGTIVDVANAAVMLVRLHQILCGHLPNEDGSTETLGTERIEEALEIRRQVSGPVIFWTHFVHDESILSEALKKEGDRVGIYRGSDTQKSKVKADFLSGKLDDFIANAASGGTGLNLQGSCRNVIRYSSSYNAVHWWQSEDRTHRMGTTGSVTYFDLVAQKSIDRHRVRNLSGKKSISDLTLDDIRRAITE